MSGQGTQSGTSMKTVWSVVILAIVIIVGWYAYKAGLFGAGIEKAPEISREQLIGEQPLTTNQTDAIAKHKQEILNRIAQGTPLTQEEREAFGKTMLMSAHLYQFTDAETEAIFKALKAQ